MVISPNCGLIKINVNVVEEILDESKLKTSVIESCKISFGTITPGTEAMVICILNDNTSGLVLTEHNMLCWVFAARLELLKKGKDE